MAHQSGRQARPGQAEQGNVPKAHLVEFQPKAGSRKRHQSGHMGLASPMNGRRAKRAPARRAGQAVHGPLVKRSRHRPLTPVTRVRFPHGSPIAGVYNAEVPPVPIPNTEVKLSSAEDTWREAAWENRSMPAQKKDTLARVFFLSPQNLPGEKPAAGGNPPK